MALNFPDSPTLGQVYTDTTSGFSYEWTGSLWKSYSASSAANIQVLDDISSSFNNSTLTFTLTSNGSAVTPVNSQQLDISLGGVIQEPLTDYLVDGSNITFTTAPSAGLSFFGKLLGSALPLNTIVDGSVNPASIDPTKSFDFSGITVGVGYSVGIGTTNPPYHLTVTEVGAGPTPALSYCIADFTNNINGYSQVNIRNASTAANASGDLVITTDNGTDTTNYIDLGINNTGFTNPSWTINGALDGYLYSSNQNLSIGVAFPDRYLSFFAGGTLASNEKMRVNSNGIGIGTTNPQETLSVLGNVRVGGALTVTGDFTVNGTQTIINTQTLDIADRTIGIGSTSTPSDALADGAGIVVYGTTNKTLSYDNTRKGWDFNIPLTTDEVRFYNVAEKLTRIDGNTVNLVYSSNGSNIGLATNPSGDITLNVTGIPTDSSFDNHVITFSVFVTNTGTARSCTAINLNGFAETINWAGGSLAAAISGVTTSTGIDIYSFTGINTVGSASTTANYRVLGVVNGGFR